VGLSYFWDSKGGLLAKMLVFWENCRLTVEFHGLGGILWSGLWEIGIFCGLVENFMIPRGKSGFMVDFGSDFTYTRLSGKIGLCGSRVDIGLRDKWSCDIG
jgi:hypothetical protein